MREEKHDEVQHAYREVDLRSHLFKLSQDTCIRIQGLNILEYKVVGLVRVTGKGRYLIHRGPDHMDHALKARVKIRPFRNISPGIGGVRYPVVYSVKPALNYV